MQTADVLLFPTTHDMPLRKDQEEFIRIEIERQLSDLTDSLHPHGWRKFTHFLREWGLASTAIILPVTLCLGLLTAVYIAFGHVREETEFRTHTNDTLNEIQDSLKEIRGGVQGSQLKQFGNNPTIPTNIAEAKNVLVAAASAKTRIDPTIVKDVGVKFVEAAQKYPPAWDTAAAFLNYKSFLNAATLPPFTGLVKTPTFYVNREPNHEPAPQFSVNGTVPITAAARFDQIGQSHNSGPSGDQYIFADGGSSILDGMQFKNVIFRNVHIVYRGGPVQMENTYFVNCTFDVQREPNGQSFAAAFLQSGPSTTFSAG